MLYQAIARETGILAARHPCHIKISWQRAQQQYNDTTWIKIISTIIFQISMNLSIQIWVQLTRIQREWHSRDLRSILCKTPYLKPWWETNDHSSRSTQKICKSSSKNLQQNSPKNTSNLRLELTNLKGQCIYKKKRNIKYICYQNLCQK